jgi:hypothetical protein
VAAADLEALPAEVAEVAEVAAADLAAGAAEAEAAVVAAVVMAARKVVVAVELELYQPRDYLLTKKLHQHILLEFLSCCFRL